LLALGGDFLNVAGIIPGHEDFVCSFAEDASPG